MFDDARKRSSERFVLKRESTTGELVVQDLLSESEKEALAVDDGQTMIELLTDDDVFGKEEQTEIANWSPEKCWKN